MAHCVWSYRCRMVLTSRWSCQSVALPSGLGLHVPCPQKYPTTHCIVSSTKVLGHNPDYVPCGLVGACVVQGTWLFAMLSLPFCHPSTRNAVRVPSVSPDVLRSMQLDLTCFGTQTTIYGLSTFARHLYNGDLIGSGNDLGMNKQRISGYFSRRLAQPVAIFHRV